MAQRALRRCRSFPSPLVLPFALPSPSTRIHTQHGGGGRRRRHAGAVPAGAGHTDDARCPRPPGHQELRLPDGALRLQAPHRRHLRHQPWQDMGEAPARGQGHRCHREPAGHHRPSPPAPTASAPSSSSRSTQAPTPSLGSTPLVPSPTSSRHPSASHACSSSLTQGLITRLICSSTETLRKLLLRPLILPQSLITHQLINGVVTSGPLMLLRLLLSVPLVPNGVLLQLRLLLLMDGIKQGPLYLHQWVVLSSCGCSYWLGPSGTNRSPGLGVSRLRPSL
ncbi:uncharacterized protein LOC133911747 [Phragmites australis]|uniref:uncharacterized protein LOC133911747 n=1 Tax=Phragmites australis TaxID=29695 RepID=UPI002D7A3E57|nr:uncharacterized protein LOC133911747 [Phragmites australis]